MPTPDACDYGAYYFAFVESIDPLPVRHMEEIAPSGWRSILADRERKSLPQPTHAVWLDCVEREYFLSLPWRGERCERGNAEHASRRRRRLRRLDRSRFIVALVLLSEHVADEAGPLREFQEADWHQVSLWSANGIPTSVAGDFEQALEGAVPDVRYVQHEDKYSDDRRRELQNVFSLDFIPDFDIDKDESGPPRKPDHPLDGGMRVDDAKKNAEFAALLRIAQRLKGGGGMTR